MNENWTLNVFSRDCAVPFKVIFLDVRVHMSRSSSDVICYSDANRCLNAHLRAHSEQQLMFYYFFQFIYHMLVYMLSVRLL